jgi:hypothetical protein
MQRHFKELIERFWQRKRNLRFHGLFMMAVVIIRRQVNKCNMGTRMSKMRTIKFETCYLQFTVT